MLYLSEKERLMGRKNAIFSLFSGPALVFLGLELQSVCFFNVAFFVKTEILSHS
jgi:hypothetical protein